MFNVVLEDKGCRFCFSISFAASDSLLVYLNPEMHGDGTIDLEYQAVQVSDVEF
jgi:hypothetical protein